jgi:hypothetical protein
VQGGKIRILGGSLAGMEVPVSARVILGRDPTKAQIVFPSEDTAVSRQHCEIRLDSTDGLFEVRDLGSRNGTFVTNGSDPPRRLAPDVAERLAPEHYILVGSSRNRLALELDRARLVDDVQRHANADQNMEAGWIPILGGLLPGGETAVLTLLVSVAIAVVGIIVVFFVLSLVGLDRSIAGTAATAIIGGIPYLRDSLDKSGLLRARRTHRTVLSFDGFGLSPQKLILNGTLILFAAMNLSAALVGVAKGGAALDFKTIALVATIVVYPTIFLVGRWVGRRSVSKGLLAIFLICVFARLASSLLDLTLMSTKELTSYTGMSVWQQIVLGVAFLFAVGCLGYWRGRRQRLAAYLTYLLGRVPTDRREAIVKLAFAQASGKGVA